MGIRSQSPSLPTPGLGGGENGGPSRALVVDDDSAVAEVVTEALSRVGYDVKAVALPDQALAAFDAYGPDVLITDWKMPGMDGIELITRLKARDPHLASILMTGFGSTETVIDAFTRGKINYYLAKPFRLEDLQATVAAALKERRISLSEREFRRRLESEIRDATRTLADKNRELKHRHREAERLNKELKKHQQEIERTKNYLENLLESSADGIVSADLETRVTFFSQGAEEMFGYRARELMGQPLALIFRDAGDDLARLLAQLKKRRRLMHFEATLKKKNGEGLVADISSSRLRPKGEGGFLLIIKDVAERKRLEEQLRSSNQVLEKLSVTDGLTGLFNHRHFQSCLADEFIRARRFGTNLSLIMLDLDDFKKVNDTYGHPVGDRVLITLAGLIRECLREVDTPARYGGEEFAVLLPQTAVEDAVMVAGRLKDAIAQSPRFGEIHPDIRVTASLGVSGYPEKAVRTPEDLIRYADKALYRAKEIGKNRVVIGGSAGETPLGKGEHLTPAEKKALLRRMADLLRGTLNLEKALAHILDEVAGILDLYGERPPVAIWLMDRFKGLRQAAARDRRKKKAGPDFSAAAHQAMENRAPAMIPEGEPGGPAAAFPIVVDWPGERVEVVGVLVLGMIPPDPGFFRDLTNQAALALVNAKLFQEIEVSKQSLEVKVNQLMTLSLMSMTLQRNALTYPDYDDENRKLLARCLAQVGFERVLVYEYDARTRTLWGGVDDSPHGDQAPSRLSLVRLPQDGRMARALTPRLAQMGPVLFLPPLKELTSAERRLFRDMGVTGQAMALGRIMERDQVRGLVVALKNQLAEDDGEVLSMFILHAGLVMENLALSQKSQDKSRRLTLIHEIGTRLAQDVTPRQYSETTRVALDGLVDVLGASEISVYTYQKREPSFHLLAYTSVTARSGREPAPRSSFTDSPLMGLVVEEALRTGQPDPVILVNVKDRLVRKPYRRYRSHSYMGLPIWAGGELVGVMNLTDKLDHSEFTHEDAELAQITAGLVAVAPRQAALVRDMENRALDAVQRLVQGLEAGSGGVPTGRAVRVAELAAALAEAMDYSAEDVDSVRRTAWYHLLSVPQRFREEAPPPLAVVQTCVASVREWLIRLGPDEPADSGSSPRSPEAPRPREAEIIGLAEFLEDRLLGLSPKHRPPWPELIQEMASAETGFDPDVAAAFFTLLVRGRFGAGTRRVKLSAEDVHELTKSLGRLARMDAPPTPAGRLARRFLAVLKESEARQG